MECLKILIIGHARHGKDTVAEIIASRLGMKFQSSSEAVCELLVFPQLSAKYGYKTPNECFKDRANHRAEWYDIITEYNKEDLTRLARLILARNNIYVGMRNWNECQACIDEKVFDYVIWVDAHKRMPLEPVSSMTVTQDQANVVIDNNGSLKDLNDKIDAWLERVRVEDLA